MGTVIMGKKARSEDRPWRLGASAGLLVALAAAAVAQTTQPATTQPAASQPGNPPAPGFDAEGSDPRAVAIADRVMETMGGRAAWDQTRYITWTFFGRRRHLWDKHAKRVRIEGIGSATGEPYVMLLDLDTGKGRAWSGGREVEGDDLGSMLTAGMGAWINDSYWLVMPYKLKDTGVTLGYFGEGKTEAGNDADILSLTFEGVGVTPENKYRVWVGRESGLVEQWAFFPTAADPVPAFINPWTDWRRYGGIMLSGGRGTMRGQRWQLSGIAVLEEVPETVFTSPDPVDWAALTTKGEQKKDG